MPAQTYHLIAFLVAAVVVLWTTPDVRNIGIKSGRVDKPSDRKVHQRPMVRLGGVSIFAGTMASLLIVWWLGGFGILPTDKEWQIWGVTLGGLGFFLIGLADDLLNLSPFIRLLIQILVAAGAWKAGVSIEFLTIPTVGMVDLNWLSLPITVIWLVGMVNAINWIDGLDGLAAGVSGIASVVMLVVALFMKQPQAALIAAALAGASLGFLRYNFNPAQIFMGDGGSYFMGFTLAAVGVIGLVKIPAVTAILLPYVILAVPIVDMSAVIVARLRRGKSPFVADKSHLHHRLLRAGLSQRLAVLFIYSLTLWAGSLALAIAGIPSGIVYACCTTSLLSYISWRVWKYSRNS
ncbi:undecaprenyl/decaprenyl-phosphate alpha-N-acetylglucosaminyl 1-phosphate transferase [Aetokthonos hydrillicola Thurmond2011]|uniref:Undecaprenyl/decaprenyl-phosphate alpha-N-acetylglucosaminyl 1-phosphate transferase n=1 Tax=Aetokthonos hydrillicola Thurmond2011 TaxID=2712845 RepID=A0AAP5I1B0_9CYAN|nr:MraY family glycosyltransferase [Aetokthonos hydrillicola]MBO3462792.1 undecaprenyl/decaprenyl-phosphate alpha-N-acetylglucosaminyl 1-phosphate transferase [Aetokthonos hydrillicola CCALA 1050]MBW4590189.1 undecaprenyl/decaprenyl-phosphate alpha-N-acetylglucosaminyl 1-phosphate transferase [Aetokthonos hydrillicola CCALA 1050]MDR9893333.1 undecaprenyl/decaprenyl-phosphate alpha-N-acetylglucosaminyl 1-phosphate transferase [Aetokthonos hydrillicola Thurmond2011]